MQFPIHLFCFALLLLLLFETALTGLFKLSSILQSSCLSLWIAEVTDMSHRALQSYTSVRGLFLVGTFLRLKMISWLLVCPIVI